MAIMGIIRFGTETVRSLVGGITAVAPFHSESVWPEQSLPLKSASEDLKNLAIEIGGYADEYALLESRRLTAMVAIGEDKLDAIRKQVAIHREEAERQKAYLGVIYDPSGTKIIGYRDYKA